MKNFINEKELVNKIYEQDPDLTKEDIGEIINLFFQNISENLIQGNRIEIRDLGVFSVKENNIQDRKTKAKKKRSVIHFKMAKKLFDKLN